MKILISPTTTEEAKSILGTGVDVIDVKNVGEGSLGAQSPWITREIADLARSAGKQSSAAIGDLPFRPAAAALAAFGAAATGVDFIKAGLYGVSHAGEAIEMLAAIRRAVEMARPQAVGVAPPQAVGVAPRQAALVACGYADYRSFSGLDPAQLVAAAAAVGCQLVMLDTSVKRGTLFDWLSASQLRSFVSAAHDAGLGAALAGSLQPDHAERLLELAPDLIGIRGAVCRGPDRDSPICPQKVEAFVERLSAAKCGPGTP